MGDYLLVFASSLALSALFTPLAGALGHRFGLLDLPWGRRQHSRRTPRLGGIGLFVGFAGASGLAYLAAPITNQDDSLRITGVLLGCGFVFFTGLLDDWLDLQPAVQLVAQFLAALIAISTTVFIERFTNPIDNQIIELHHWPIIGQGLVIAFTAFWIMGMMNTVNWLDGLDGLAAGVGAIAAILFAVHMRSMGQPQLSLYALALAGACLGFLPFNFSPARVFLGSAGAMVLGYALATLSILAPARVATALLIMAVPISDTAWQIFDRRRHGYSLFRADRGHLHFRLLDLGLPARSIVIVYWSFCALFGILSLLIESRLYKLLALGLLAAIVVASLALLSSRQSKP